MVRFLGYFAAAFMLCATVASAQTTLKAAPTQQRSLFCDLCKIQGCDCTGSKCINCVPGSLTSNTGGTEGQQQLNLKSTQSVCAKANGRMSRGACQLN